MQAIGHYEVILNVALRQPLRKSYLGCSYAQKKVV